MSVNNNNALISSSYQKLKNNYLYYALSDQEGKIRGNIIGVCHWVDAKDKNLNQIVLNAIDRSAKVILEQPPGSGLLPNVSNSFDYVIDKAIKHLKITPIKEKLLSFPLGQQVQNRLNNFDDRIITSDEGFKKIADTLPNIENEFDQLKFLEEIEKNLFEFNQVSFELNINERILSKNQIWAPLEEIDLRNELNKAEQKIEIRLIQESSSSKIIEINGVHPNDEIEFDSQALKEQSYRAWVNGDVENLRIQTDKNFEINKEPPEIAEVHQFRDQKIAERIVELVTQDKNSEITFIVGCDHLVYTKRKNILAHLSESNDLKKWSIKQIKPNQFT
ncbi:MAG: hypothetical protein JHC93_05645 [Parachlamydiales bacterium]|nr:hypothetical protein [Parachlamydiales bacterium]